MIGSASDGSRRSTSAPPGGGEPRFTHEDRIALAATHRLCALESLCEGTANHISYVRPEDPEHMLMTPGRTHWRLVSASKLCIYGAGGRLLAGERRPNRSAWPIHAPMRRDRPDVACLIHVHATYSTALFLDRTMRFDCSLSQAASEFRGHVGYFDVYDGALTAEEEGGRMAAALGGGRVLVLRNHGVIVAGTTIAHAFYDLYYFERACRLQWLAGADESRRSRIPESVIAEIEADAAAHPGDAADEFAAWCELLDRIDPGYRD